MNKVKGLFTFGICIITTLLATAASAQIEDLRAAAPASANQDRIVVERGERQLVHEEVSGLAEYDRKTNTTTIKGENGQVQRITGRIHKERLSCERIVNNYDYRTGKPFKQRLSAGTEVWVDEKGMLVAKASCKNPLSTPVESQTNTKQTNTTVYMQRERTLEYETVINTHHYHVDQVDRYVPLIVLAPQQQYIGNLGAPTVIAPQAAGMTFGGFGGNIKINNNVAAFGGTGGNGYGYGAAAAAAAAAASSSSTSATPTSAAGTSGGSSSGGSAGSNGGPSNSGSGSH